MTPEVGTLEAVFELTYVFSDIITCTPLFEELDEVVGDFFGGSSRVFHNFKSL